MEFKIKHHATSKVLFSFETESLKLAIEAAIKAKANLRGADLWGASLRGADLWGANLEGADLWGANLEGANLEGANLEGANLEGANLEGASLRGANLEGASLEGASLEGASLRGASLWGANLNQMVLETGESFETYLKEVVPALIASGGHPVAKEAWSCHSWKNCPMAVAFGVKRLEDIPVLYRPRVEQFIRYFDARLIPEPSYD